MEKMVNVFLFGKRYQVPESLTIMKAMEYAGYQLVRGCGCRNGFCGACATIYRIHGQQELKTCLACQQQVEEGMYVATLPFFPLVKQIYDINQIKPTQQTEKVSSCGASFVNFPRSPSQLRSPPFSYVLRSYDFTFDICCLHI